MEPTAAEPSVTTKAARAATAKTATAVATTTAPAAARHGCVWLRKYQNARERRYCNSEAACDANASHADPLLSVAARLAADGAGSRACYRDRPRLRMKSNLISRPAEPSCEPARVRINELE